MNIKNYTISIGISLCILGVSLGNFIRVLTGINLVIPFMIISILCMVDFRNMIRFKFPNISKDIFILLLSQLIIVLYMLMGSLQETNVSKDIFVYYSVILIFAVGTLPKKYLNKFILVFYILSSINVVMALYLFFNGFGGMMTGNVDKDYLNSLEDTGKAMVFLYPSAGVTHTMATLALLKDNVIRNKLLRVFFVLFLFVDFILIISSGKRTVVLIFILYILYYLWNERKFSSLKNFIKFVPVIIILFLTIKYLLPHIPFITDFVNDFVDHLQKGIDTLFGLDKSNYDESAAVRVDIRRKASFIFSTDFSLVNYFFGKGYMTMYMDQPLLQCVFDMGLVGVFVYIYNVLYVSIKHLVRKTNDSIYFMFKLGCINIVLTCLTAGTPYGYQMYFPVLFMLYAYHNQKTYFNVTK